MADQGSLALWNKQLLYHVNHARIRSWNQPVLSNKSKSFLLKAATGAFDGTQTHDWQVSTNHESDALPNAPRTLDRGTNIFRISTSPDNSSVW